MIQKTHTMYNNKAIDMYSRHFKDLDTFYSRGRPVKD